MAQHLLTVAEVAEELGVSEKTVYKLKADGTLPFVKLSPQRLRFAREDVDAFVAASRGQVAA